MRRGRLVFLALLAACPGPGARPSAPTPLARPKVVVLVVVDQLPTWTFERDRAHFRGGFARLLREGGYVARGELPYANPFTAPGHASIATGAPPSLHGIVGNSWYRRDEGRDRSAEHDPDAPVFAIAPSHDGELSPDDVGSGRALRVEGVADRLLAETGGKAHAIAIGLKARAVSFVIGRQPQLAIWYEAPAGGMTTSRAYAATPPAWLVDHARTRPATRFFRETWRPLDPAVLGRVGVADAASGEGDVHGLGTTFPHDLAASDKPAQAFLHTPYGDELVLDTALAALDAIAIGRDDIPDLLALCFNAHDYAGHLWGPDSWEALDVAMRLDGLLGRLFDELDRRFGADGWAAVLASDHGATPVVERTTGGRRITTAELRGVLEDTLGRALGGGPWVASIVSSNVYLKPAFTAVPRVQRDAALDEAAAALARVPGIAGAGRTDRIATDCARRTGIERAICLSVVAGASGELYVVPASGSLISDYRTGTHHDAPFDDNRQVPILVRAPGLAPQAGNGSLLQVAPTVAALLGIPPPSAASEPPLFGIAPARAH